ncbi:MAG TPA: hypothetical protein VFF81_01745 [Noviherbaspirillum sp.]|nr:hypothetical protein [Noviherbaspirillum sp.]
MRSALPEYRALKSGGSIAAHEDSDRLRACLRFVEGNPTKEDIAWVSNAMSTYLTGCGQLPLERCLHLPSTHGGWLHFQRDLWLCKAAALISASGSWTGAQKLAQEWNTFLSRGPWQAWRDEDSPPDYATPLSEALFYASRFNRSRSLGAKQLRRIVGHVFSKEGGECHD